MFGILIALLVIGTSIDAAIVMMDIYKIDLSSGKLFGAKNPAFENETEDESRPTETLEIKLKKDTKKDTSIETHKIHSFVLTKTSKKIVIKIPFHIIPFQSRLLCKYC